MRVGVEKVDVLGWNKSNGRYDMILGRDLLIALGLDIKFSDNAIIFIEGPHKGFSAPMVDLINYDFKFITDKTVKPEESFINSYVKKCLKSDSAISSTRRICILLDVKYKKADINKVMA